MFNVKFEIGSLSRRFKKLRDELTRGNITRNAAHTLVRNTAGWIFRRSVSRHKTAQKFGIEPSGILEFVANGNTAVSKGGGRIFSRKDGRGYSMYITGVPFIQKAFRALKVTPRKASALTIPLDAISARKSVKELKNSGWNIFRPNGYDVLLGTKRKGQKPIALYALVKSAKIPRDAQLLPSSYLMNLWTQKSVAEQLAKL